ncbi:hypothetical protein FACS1894151_04430 [Spirochaetia bacterium]|nr:hypothetical protein FACS1894151_04430 [Spirochaetia bacterium]
MQYIKSRLFMPVLSAFFAAAFWSCSTGTPVQSILSGVAEAPVFVDCKTVASRQVEFRFSLPVKVRSLQFDPALEVDTIGEGETVSVSWFDDLPEGERITADILVEDDSGNTLNVLVPFRTRNDRIPAFMITEVRTEYSKPKVEFIEIKTSSAGNLGALRMYIAGGGIEEPVLDFPPVEVKAGEYLVIHLRTPADMAVHNETGANLASVPYTKDNEAQEDARDFWVPEAKKRITRKADAVWFTDQDDRIIDALLLSESADPWWSSELMADTAALLHAQGAWIAPNGEIPGPAAALISKNGTATRTICRDESAPDTNSAGDWYITATSSATPGKPNNVKRYEPK